MWAGTSNGGGFSSPRSNGMREGVVTRTWGQRVHERTTSKGAVTLGIGTQSKPQDPTGNLWRGRDYPSLILLTSPDLLLKAFQ